MAHAVPSPPPTTQYDPAFLRAIAIHRPQSSVARITKSGSRMCSWMVGFRLASARLWHRHPTRRRRDLQAARRQHRQLVERRAASEKLQQLSAVFGGHLEIAGFKGRGSLHFRQCRDLPDHLHGTPQNRCGAYAGLKCGESGGGGGGGSVDDAPGAERPRRLPRRPPQPSRSARGLTKTWERAQLPAGSSRTHSRHSAAPKVGGRGDRGPNAVKVS